MLPPKKETEQIQTHKHEYRAKPRRLQKSDVQVLKENTNQILEKIHARR